jgi:hypothetical protein
VPEGETTASLILRNYCLDNNGGPGQSIFIVKNVKMAIQDNDLLLPMQTVKFEPTNNPIFFNKNYYTRLKITTDHNNLASYQAISSSYSVTPGQRLEVNYDFDVEQGIISLGALNTQRNGWFLTDKGDQSELICSQGQHKGKITWVVPAGEKTASFVLRNYFLDSNGQSIFKVKNVNIEVPDFSYLPGDLWIAIATNLLNSNGRKNLSQVSHQCMKLMDKATTYLQLRSAPQVLNDLECTAFLNRLPSKLILHLGCPGTIPGHILGALTNLKHLRLENNNNINDQHIALLTNLESLSLHRAPEINCHSLNGLTKLRGLNVKRDVHVQGKHIDQLTNLTDLSLENSEGVEDNTLQKLTNLEHLSLNRSPATDLCLLTKLKSLQLTPKSLLIKGIPMLTRLEALELNGQHEASKLNSFAVGVPGPKDAVSYLTNLTSLCAISISTIDFISPLTKLRRLAVMGNSPLNGLPCLTNLTSLYLDNSTSITNICNFSNLTQLSLFTNSPIYLHNLPNLRIVQFDNTDVLVGDPYLEDLISKMKMH